MGLKAKFKKLMSITLSGLLFCSVSPINVEAVSAAVNDDSPKTMISESISNINLDGLLDEDIWQSRQSLAQLAAGDERTISADYSTAWDSNNFYIGLEVTDPSGKITNFEDNSMTFYMAPKNYRGTPYSKDDFQIQVFDCGKTIQQGAATVGRNDYVDCSKVKVESHYTEKGYTMEISMPWSEIGIEPKDGCELGFDIMAFTGDESCILQWADGSWIDTTKFGTITLKDIVTRISTKDCYEPDENLTIDYSCAQAGDTIGIFKSDKSQIKDVLIEKTVTHSKGTLEFTKDEHSLAIGSYKAMIYRDGQVLSSTDFVVNNLNVKSQKDVYECGEDIVLNYAAANPSNGDWIGIYEADYIPGQDAAHPSVVWKNTDAESGSMTFSGEEFLKATHPDYSGKAIKYLLPGEYKAYLLRNGGYEFEGEPCSFKVSGKTESTIELDKSVYQSDSTITINYNNSYNSKDWVGIYKKGIIPGSDNPSYAFKYADNENGQITFTQEDIINYQWSPIKGNPLPNGEYEAVLLEDDGYTVLARVPFTIRDLGITLDRTRYANDFNISVKYAGSKYDADWVGIYKRNSIPGSDNPCFAFKYLNGENGEITFSQEDVKNNQWSPLNGESLPNGEYDIIYMENDSYDVLQRVPFVICDNPDIPETASKVEYTRTSAKTGYAEGTAAITAPEDASNVSGYALYWGKGNTKLEGYTYIAEVPKNGEKTEYKFRDNTFIPEDADTLLVYSKNGSIESKDAKVFNIPEEWRLSKEKPITSFEVMSDLHVASWDSITNKNFEDALKDLHDNALDTDGVFLVGDSVDNSTDPAYEKFNEIFKKYTLPEFNFVIGNHEYFETTSSDPHLPENLKISCEVKAQKFLDNMQELGNAPSLYYDKYINGIHCIVLGSEQTDVKDDFAYISDTQFKWLENKLKETKDKNEPIFIFLHQAMKDTISGTTNGNNWFGIYDDQAQRLRKLFKKYPQVIMFNGHSHWVIDDNYEMYDGAAETATIFNTASAGYLWSDAGETINGSQGLYVEVYKDKILVRGRDFNNQLWKPNSLFMVDLKEKLPKLEKEDKKDNTPAKQTAAKKVIKAQNRYKSSVSIAEKVAPSQVKDIVIAAGNDFPDALCGSVLAKKYGAPILLSSKNSQDNTDALEYIKNHLTKDGTVHILGGTGAVQSEIIEEINKLGVSSIKRLSGKDRYDTCSVVNKEINVKKGTPVFIVTGKNFADALSVSSIASIKGYPILLTNNNTLPSVIKNNLKNIAPSKVYIIGGTGSVSEAVKKQIKTITGINDGEITRLAGKDRYETSIKVSEHFNLDSDTVCLASGKDCKDALSGSVFAAVNNAHIVLMDKNVDAKKKSDLDSKYKNMIIFGENPYNN